MQREIREFANKMSVVCKFANSIFISICTVDVYVKICVSNPFFLSKKRGENREKSEETIGYFSKYLRILGEVS